MRAYQRKARGLLALSALLLGACQLVTGLSGYHETGGSGGGGPATSSSTSSSGAGGDAGPQDVVVVPASKSGAAIDGGAGIFRLLAAGGYVGWTANDMAGGTVRFWSSSSGVSKPPGPGIVLSELAMDPTYLYFIQIADGGAPSLLHWRLGPSTTPTTLATNPATSLFGLAADGTGVAYYGDSETDGGDGIWSITPDNNSPPNPIQPTMSGAIPRLLSADPYWVFWIAEVNSDIYRAQVVGVGSDHMLGTYFQPTASAVPVEIALDPAGNDVGNVYWLMSDGTLCGHSKALATASCPVLATGLTNPRSLALLAIGDTATHVYWTETSTPGDCTVLGSVYQLAVGMGDGGPTVMPNGVPTVFADNVACPQVAVDSVDGYVYWSNGGEIHRKLGP